MLIGYARVSTERQDLAAQLKGLADLGVARERVYTDKRTGRSMKNRPGLAQAIAALRPGDVLVVTKLDRLARSVPDARDLVGQVYAKGAALQLGPSLHDPEDPVGKFLFNALAMVAEFESDAADTGHRVLVGLGRVTGRNPRTGNEIDQTELQVLDRSVHGRAESDVTITADAAALDLWLRHRGPAHPVEMEGDEALLDRLLGVLGQSID